MEKYIDAEKLIVEIDRQKIGYNTDGEHAAEYNTCRKILDIITSLQQEDQEDPDKSLEEAALGNYYGGGYIPKNQELREVALKTKEVQAFIAGAEWQKEQMLKDVVETEVWSYSSDEDLRAIPLFGIDKFNNLKDGDKVKVIVLKDESK